MSDNIIIRKITEKDDFGRIAELIFQVDPFICPDFFGDSLRARNFGPLIIKPNGTLFDIDHIFVAEENQKLLGVIIYADNKISSWDYESLKTAAENAGISLPENFERANKNYMKPATEEAKTLPDGVVEIEFLATDSSSRGKGIGGKLLDAVLNLPEYQEQRLTVLADNPPAIHLYEKKGFKIISSQTGYPNDSVKTHNMVREVA